MIPLKAIFVISILISGLIFSPSYSFAQSTTDDSPLSSFFEILRQIFSFNEDQSEPIIEFGDAVIIQTSGTSSTTDTTENNILPIANAGPNQDVLEFETVTLDGSSSTDVDGTIQSYFWTQVSDPLVELSSTSEINPKFVAPKVESDDLVLRFSLKVTDNSGDSTTDEVDITVKNVNSPPTANAGSDQNVLEFATVTLDGSSSTDVDGTISYEWTQLFETTITLSSSSSINPTFIAPDVNSEKILTFKLTVTDNSGDSSDDEVEITVNGIDDPNNDDPNNDDPNNDDPNNDDPNNDNPNNDNPNNDNPNNDNPNNDNPNNDNPNNDNPNIGESAVDTHLAHGDTLGECNENKSNDGNENENNNSDKGNSGVNNSGKENQKDKDNEKKSNSGKGNKNDKKVDDDENENNNSGKGNSGVNNSGKDNKNNNKSENEDDPNSEKDTKDENDDELEDENEKEDDDRDEDDN
jgi:hypothetical protein